MAGFAAAIQSDVLRRLVAHWSRICGQRRMPARADFDPLEVRYALGYISLIQVHRDPLRFYFRLDGTKQVDLFGVDCTRRYLDEAMPPDHARMAAAAPAGSARPSSSTVRAPGTMSSTANSPASRRRLSSPNHAAGDGNPTATEWLVFGSLVRCRQRPRSAPNPCPESASRCN